MSTIDAIPTAHRFNDDLLHTVEDRTRAASAYPNFYFALDFPELREQFDVIDVHANTAKRQCRRAGLVAITLGTLALFFASAAPALDGLAEWFRHGIGVFTAILGVISVLVGLRSTGYGSAKSSWLRCRFLTERLRQLHFQILAMGLTDILDARDNVDKRAAYKNERLRHLNAFKQQFIEHADAEFEQLITQEENPQGIAEDWLITRPDSPAPHIITPDAKEFLQAYRDLRISHQLNYAYYQLRTARQSFDFPCQRQDQLLGSIGITCIALIFLIHMVYAAGSFLPWSESSIQWIHIAVIWTAIVALAARALEEGLKPQRETERYRGYALQCRLVRERFDKARYTEEKFLAMLELERIAYEEMRGFLVTNRQARFIL